MYDFVICKSFKMTVKSLHHLHSVSLNNPTLNNLPMPYYYFISEQVACLKKLWMSETFQADKSVRNLHNTPVRMPLHKFRFSVNKKGQLLWVFIPRVGLHKQGLVSRLIVGLSIFCNKRLACNFWPVQDTVFTFIGHTFWVKLFHMSSVLTTLWP